MSNAPLSRRDFFGSTLGGLAALVGLSVPGKAMPQCNAVSKPKVHSGEMFKPMTVTLTYDLSGASLNHAYDSGKLLRMTPSTDKIAGGDGSARQVSSNYHSGTISYCFDSPVPKISNLG